MHEVSLNLPTWLVYLLAGGLGVFLAIVFTLFTAADILARDQEANWKCDQWKDHGSEKESQP